MAYTPLLNIVSVGRSGQLTLRHKFRNIIGTFVYALEFQGKITFRFVSSEFIWSDQLCYVARKSSCISSAKPQLEMGMDMQLKFTSLDGCCYVFIL